MKRLILPLLCVALIGAGCQKADPSDDGDDRDVSVALEDPGLDASLSLMAFDRTAESYLAYLSVTADAPTPEGFAAWLEEQGTSRDMFAQTIQMRTEREGFMTLWTEGRDGEAGNEDDFWKHYSTAHVTTTGDVQ